MNVFSVYINYSSSLKKYYVGYTIEIQKRLVEHNTGISTFTSKAKDWELKWQKVFGSREKAIKSKKRIKSKKSRIYIVVDKISWLERLLVPMAIGKKVTPISIGVTSTNKQPLKKGFFIKPKMD